MSDVSAEDDVAPHAAFIGSSPIRRSLAAHRDKTASKNATAPRSFLRCALNAL